MSTAQKRVVSISYTFLCADLGRLNNYSHIDHPLHPQHPLTFHFDSFPNDQTEFVCSFCKETKTSGFLLHCAHCDFYLDFFCALNFQSKETLLSQYKFRHFFHPHQNHTLLPHRSLFSGFGIKNRCKACGLYIEHNELVLMCSGLSCKYYLHVHCFRVPKVMKHPLHPQHTLTLLERPPQPKLDDGVIQDIASTPFRCNACQDRIMRDVFVLHCNQCPDFILDIRCAYINPNFKCDRHDHLLAYFDSYWGSDDRCAVCNALCSINGKLYRCLDCNFNVHEACLSLPLNVDSENGVHHFTLITSLNEDETGIYFCDICEKRREPNYGLYSCVDCPSYVAHFECVLPPSYAKGDPHWISEHPLEHIEFEEETPTLRFTADKQQLVSQLYTKIEKMGEMLKRLFNEGDRENVTEKLDKLEKRYAEAEGMLRQLRELIEST